jgi:thiosulfate dehydrogenase [quinone] large subunit
MWSVKGSDGTVPTGWVLMPLRLFLGVTFFFAGLQKLANPQFFKAASPISIHAQLVGASHSSPIHALIIHLVPIASPVGAVIAAGEVAIGLGMLVGLFMRVAAVAGMALSFGLFLTVSFHSSPYFTGSDIVFFFAWTPVALAGAAGAPALDTWLASRRRESSHEARDGAVPRRLVLSTKKY